MIRTMAGDAEPGGCEPFDGGPRVGLLIGVVSGVLLVVGGALGAAAGGRPTFVVSYR
jgi:hypothetical protein